MDGEEQFFFNEREFDDYLQALRTRVGEVEVVDESGTSADSGDNGQSENGGENRRPQLRRVELHECEGLKRQLAQLGGMALSVDDLFLKRSESISGERIATKFAIRDEKGNDHDVENLSTLAQQIRELGASGMDIKRFKGLGEMNADELWDTTMDRSRRVLLQISIEDAAAADRMFAILMGDNVEQRRQFIESHAVEVKNLDI